MASSYTCNIILAFFIAISFSGMEIGLAARHLLQTTPSGSNLPKPTLPPIPTLPQGNVPPLPTIPSLPQPSLPSIPTIPNAPQLSLPPLPAATSPPNFPSIPVNVPTTFPSFPFFSPPPSSTTNP